MKCTNTYHIYKTKIDNCAAYGKIKESEEEYA